MKAIVTIQQSSRRVKPKFGPFRWSNRHKALVWKGAEATGVQELAAQVNDAHDFLRQNDNAFIVMRVVVLDEAPVPVVEAPAQAPAPRQLRRKAPAVEAAGE